jgi:hypothetical protein
MKTFARLMSLLMAISLLVALPLTAVILHAQVMGSGVRIVRISEVHGVVQMDRTVSHGYEAVMLNMPVTQGARLKTDAGAAEVEFEDNSSLRLIPNTEIEFTQLGRTVDGSTTSAVHVVKGTVFVSMAPSKGNGFSLLSGFETVSLNPLSHVEFHAGSPQDALMVLKGTAVATVNGNATTVPQKKTLLFDGSGSPQMVSRIEKSPYDEWDKSAVAYHARSFNSPVMRNAGYLGSGMGSPVYGLNDLGYYGSFSDAGGCGNLWRPYFASANWDPYGNGMWALYQGAGYSWVSPYPWGWMPYHSGNWVNCGGAGWGWQPGGNFVGLENAVMPLRPTKGPVRVGPPHRPPVGLTSLVLVNEKPLTKSTLDNRVMVFRNDSAGLGVPREAFGKLNHVSVQAQRSGTVTRSFGSTAGGAAGRASNGSVSGSASRGTTAGMSMASSTGVSHGGSAGGSSSGGGHR